METIVYTSYPCIISCDGKSETLTRSEHMLLGNAAKFKVKSQERESSFDVDIESLSPFYRVAKKQDTVYVFLLSGLIAENITCQEFNYNGKKSRIEVSKKEIIFCGQKDKKIIKLAKPIKNMQLGNFLFIDYILIKDNDESMLIAYNTLTNSAKSFVGEAIEIEKDGFTLKKHPFNYESIEEHYIVDKEGLKVKEKKFKARELSSQNAEMIVYKFMNGIKCGDYNTCIAFLTPSLRQNITAQKLKEYFGQVGYFYMLSPYSCFAISDNKNVIYEFQISGNKVSDITDNLDKNE